MIHLAPLSMKFVAEVQQYASDPRVTYNTLLPEPYPENGAEMFIEWVTCEENSDREFPFVILENDQFAGMIGITRIDWGIRVGEIGYWLAVPFWGKGYATEAVKQLTQLAFETLPLDRIVAIILKRNPASMRVVEKAGYRYVGEVIEKYDKFLGETSMEYEMTREQWTLSDLGIHLMQG